MIAQTKSLEELKAKDKAHILIVSDSHGAYRVLKFVLENKISNCDALIFCGDGIGDILRLYAQDPEIFPPVITCVRGNNDSATYSTLINGDYRNISIDETQTLDAAGHRIFITHGHRSNVYLNFDSIIKQSHLLNADIVAFGHTHIALSETVDDIMLINPGSVALPRGGQPQTFAILDIERNSSQGKVNFYMVDTKECPPYKVDRNFTY